VTPNAKKITAALLLGLLALPTGVCSLVFTPVGFASYFGRDALERDIGLFALICSAVGWVICGLAIWGGLRLHHSAVRDEPPTASP